MSAPYGKHLSKVFVTVGTTRFDKLIETVTTEEICNTLCDRGCKTLQLQIGAGDFIPPSGSANNVTIEYYKYKPSIADDIREADLIISHAGAGSVLESLGAGKPLVVVINEELMNNHQLELAHQLHQDGHLVYATCSSLRTVLEKTDFSTLKQFEPGKPEKFSTFLDRVMGVS